MLEGVARLAIVGVGDEKKLALGGYVEQVIDDGVGRLDV